MNPTRRIITSIPPSWLTVSGLLLILAAWPLSKWKVYYFITPTNSVAMGIAALASSFFAAFVLFRRLPPWRFFYACLTLLALLLASFNNDPHRAHLVVAHSVGLAGFLLMMAGGWLAHNDTGPLARIGRWLDTEKYLAAPRFGWIASIMLTALGLLVCWHCYHLVPIYTDSTAQYIHGKFIASGHYFSIPSHPLKEFFPVWMMVNSDGRWYSQYQPLHQTLLGIGHILHAPWLANPVVSGLTCIVLYSVARRYYDESTARITACLMLISPFVLFLSGSFMNHTTAMLCGAVFILTYMRMLDQIKEGVRAYRWALATGLAIGAVFLTRPLCAPGIGLCFALHALWLLKTRFSLYIRPFAAMAGGVFICLLFQAWYNIETTGTYWMVPYIRYSNNNLSLSMGFGKQSNLEWVISKAHAQWAYMSSYLLEWAMPSLFFACVALLFPTQLLTRLLAGMLVCYTLIDTLNQFRNMSFGPRYLYETMPAVVLLTALGIRRLTALVASGAGSARARGVVAVAIAAMLIPSWIYRMPGHIKTYSHYFDSSPELLASLKRQSQEPALIFMGRYQAGMENPGAKISEYYRKVAHTNPPREDAPVIFAIDKGDKENRKLIDYYAGRHVYVEYNGKLQPREEEPLKPERRPGKERP